MVDFPFLPCYIIVIKAIIHIAVMLNNIVVYGHKAYNYKTVSAISDNPLDRFLKRYDSFFKCVF